MSGQSSVLDIVQRLSPRERTLVGAALALTLVIGLIYGVMTPGMAAARSAANRNADAMAGLAAARSLSASLSKTKATATLDGLRQSAEASGLSVIDANADAYGAALRVRGQGPAAILAWISRSTGKAVMRTVTIEPDPSGGVIGRIQFTGVAS